ETYSECLRETIRPLHIESSCRKRNSSEGSRQTSAKWWFEYRFQRASLRRLQSVRSLEPHDRIALLLLSIREESWSYLSRLIPENLRSDRDFVERFLQLLVEYYLIRSPV